MNPATALRPLTAVRGIAAWYVVLYHVRVAASDTLGPEIVAFLAKGYLAVDFFFMLSGFVIWLNYADRVRAGGMAEAPAFLWRRLARIYPLHLITMIGAILFVSVHIALGRPAPDHYPLAELPLHLLLVQSWGFTDALTWNDPAWSISCELAAYLAFPLLALAIDWKRWPSLALIAAACALAAGLHLVMRAGGSVTLGEQISRFGLVRCLVEFAIGTILCEFWCRWRERPAMPMLAAWAVAAAAIGLFLLGGPETLTIPIGFAGLLLALALGAERPRHPLAGRLVHYVGEISYATYLVHFLLFIAFKLFFVDESGTIGWAQLVTFLALTLAASAILYHGVERPA